MNRRNAFWLAPEAEDPETARTSIFHARSVDGGATFAEPRVVARHGGVEGIGMMALAAAPDGALLAVWSEADVPSTERGTQGRQTLRFIHSGDGEHWSAPRQLVDVGADVGTGQLQRWKEAGEGGRGGDGHRHGGQSDVDAVDAVPVSRLPAHHQQAVPVKRAQAALAQVGGEDVQFRLFGQLEQAGIPVEKPLVVEFQQPGER